MTGQVPDDIILNGESYSLIGLRGQNIFRPEDFGIIPLSASTACWRGYVMGYIISDDQLFLNEMQVNTEDPPKINGIEPQMGSRFFKYHFKDLKLKSNFTGSILLAKDFIKSMYVHMGFQRAIAFRTVIELNIENGEIILEIDMSKQIEEYRNNDVDRGARPRSNSMNDIGKWIEKTFSLDYNFE
ncbi:MAG TPA: hypothetical protein ENI29_23095 [bacterium]|nr:hypothetical protein [bacterium]